jgi:hypothetical protein
MRWLAIALILRASLCLAAPRCPDKRLRHARIGGDAITGYVLLHKKPLSFAPVRLYSPLGYMAWLGITDRDGGFVIGKLPPGGYRLEIDGWGSTSVELDPRLDQGFGGQVPRWSVVLTDRACVGAGMNMD